MQSLILISFTSLVNARVYCNNKIEATKRSVGTL